MNIETLPRPADLVVEPGEAWVRAAHENYSRTVPDLCGTLHENEREVWFLLFVPELGQVLTYRAELSSDETPQGPRPSRKRQGAHRAAVYGGAA